MARQRGNSSGLLFLVGCFGMVACGGGSLSQKILVPPPAPPPDNVVVIQKKLGAMEKIQRGSTGGVRSVDSLSAEERQVLNQYAAEIAGEKDCKLRSLDGCASCSLGQNCHSCMHGEIICGSDRYGNLAHTDCGDQCWYCTSEPCGQ